MTRPKPARTAGAVADDARLALYGLMQEAYLLHSRTETRPSHTHLNECTQYRPSLECPCDVRRRGDMIAAAIARPAPKRRGLADTASATEAAASASLVDEYEPRRSRP